jgi:1-aminocyclopropane-1-carboxylate deaminase/D-cysteine desulfhydrase-like pyridoxal-dependent ACC family enzyme
MFRAHGAWQKLPLPPVLDEGPPRETLGTYPTPVHSLAALAALAAPGASLWVKRDDLTSPLYGGNKVRKLERLLSAARARGATRIVTVGAVGSHHVLATAVFARRMGIGVDAVLVPQPRTDHALADLRADLAQGVVVVPASTYPEAAMHIGRRLVRAEYAYIPVGGSNLNGALGYVDAARELAAQVRAGLLPEPDLAVVTLGSGGTVAGLAAGFVLEKLRTKVLAVTVAEPAFVVARAARRLAVACVRHEGDETVTSRVLDRIEVDERWLGPGYGFATPQGEDATRRAAEVGLTLDQTYTAKAFAAALDAVATRRGETILYWHTLSSAPMDPLLQGAPDEDRIDVRIAHLLR